jgi:hypothetical protein
MKKSASELLLLALLGVTNAYLLAKPNLIGRVGIIIYKHDYLKTFPRALATVLGVLAIWLGIAEAFHRFFPKQKALIGHGALLVAGLGLLAHVHITFSSLAYQLTGKTFIYGAYLLPCILVLIGLRYLVYSFMRSE